MTEDDSGQEYIRPRFKIIVSYDVVPANHESYFRFIMGEFVPALQESGIYMTEAWHTAYGEYPLRMASFVAEDMQTIDDLLESERWHELEGQFLSYVRNYSISVVPFRRGFQFVR